MLGHLLPSGSVPAPVAPSKAGVLKLAIESIHRDTHQPRRRFDEAKLHELTESLKAQGLLQPILVRKDGDGYKLIAAEPRMRFSVFFRDDAPVPLRRGAWTRGGPPDRHP